MKAVVIGPGRVGCGFAGHLLHRSGFYVTFIGRPVTAARPRRAGYYVVRLTDGSKVRDELIPSNGADMHELRLAADTAATADVVGVAGGTDVFDDVGAVLAAGLSRTEAELDAILARFDSAALADTVARVGRDPRRKLRPDDRLIGPARLAIRAGASPQALATAAGVALCFSDAAQPSLTQHLAGADALLASREVENLLSEISGPQSTDALSVQIRSAWTWLTGGQGGNLLLSLRDRTWAWSPVRDITRVRAAS